jgi:hypothetical protein
MLVHLQGEIKVLDGPEGWRQALLQGEVIKYRKDQKAESRLVWKVRS